VWFIFTHTLSRKLLMSYGGRGVVNVPTQLTWWVMVRGIWDL